MYTPLRLKPRIFPAAVSATVAASEAITRLRQLPPVAHFAFESGSGTEFDTAGDRKMTEPAKPAPKVAMPPMKERRSLKAGLDSRFGSSFKVVPASLPRLSNGAILGPAQQAESLASARFLLLK
jgi:hypothetical protein